MEDAGPKETSLGLVFLGYSMTTKHQRIRAPEYIKRVAFNIFSLGHGYRTCAEILELPLYTVREWYALYKFGAYDSVLRAKRPIKFYSNDFRMKVILDYFETEMNISELSRKYEVSRRTLRRWIDAASKEKLSTKIAANSRK